MFDITPKIKIGSQQLQRYGDGSFTISNEVYSHSVLITQNNVEKWDHGDEINEDMIRSLCGYIDDIEIILLGAGESMKFLTPELKKIVRDYGLTIEVMDTGAACRTYNILLSEERKVMAALMAV